MPSLHEHAGGEEAIHRLEDVYYGKVLADPVLKPLFGEGRPHQVDRSTAFPATAVYLRPASSCPRAGP